MSLMKAKVRGSYFFFGCMKANIAGLDGVKAIDIGDSLPTLTLKNEKDEDVEIGELAAEKGVVLFLVPKADTRTLILQCFAP